MLLEEDDDDAVDDDLLDEELLLVLDSFLGRIACSEVLGSWIDLSALFIVCT